MLIPVLIVSAIGLAVVKSVRKPAPQGMTAQRRKIYEAALCTMKDPAALRKLADAFESEDCLAEARILRQRANLRELPLEIKAQRRAIFSRAINSSNVEGILKVASAFAGEGATGAAQNLRRHAASLVEQAEKLHVEQPEPVEEQLDEEVDVDEGECEEETDEAESETASASQVLPETSPAPSATETPASAQPAPPN